ncbi:MAG: SDR family oxidoreductase [Candidatus Hydrogenedentes bacterium]|nr:SDR family oxidoreductase [Candidatus Hydrogenedentota bacterium]
MGLDIFDLNGKTALVTGSSRGLGFALAEGLGKAGARLVLNGVSEHRLETAVAAMRQKGFETFGVPFDVTNSEQVDTALRSIEDEIAYIDILVNNAGIQIRADLESFTETDWDRLIDVNLKGAFVVSKRVVPGMIERRSGKIINVCSVQSELARPSIGPYAASKGGLKMLTRAMATEWGRYNIQVNGLGPGYFVTELTAGLVADPEFSSWLCDRTPAGRWGNPSELEGAIVFLASRSSDYVNGHILYVDGGMQICV